MSALTPPHAASPTPKKLSEFGTRIAAALDGCVTVATTLAEKVGSPGDGRRLSAPLYALLGGLELRTVDLAMAFRESGNRWPAGAVEAWTVVYDLLLNKLYAAAYRLVRSLSDERRGDWTPEESAVADAGDTETARSVRRHADFLRLVSEGVLACGGHGWRVVNLDSEQAEWSARRDADYRTGTALIGTLRRGAAAPRLTGLSMKVVAGRLPSRCRHALPRISAAELERADRLIRQTVTIPDGMTTHWVGEEGSRQNVCRCHPDAPYASPEQVERYLPRADAAVQPLPVVAPTSTGPATQVLAEEPGAGVTPLPVQNLVPVALAIGSKGKKINARMLEALQDLGDLARGRSAQQWANALGCAKSTVVETNTWKFGLGVQRVAKGLKNGPRKSRCH